MRFVEDHDLIARGGRGVAHHLAQFADLVDTAVRRRVNFDDIERSARGDFAAGVAFIAGLDRWALGAVERFGQDACRGRLAHAARPGKNVGVGDAVVLDGVFESGRDVLLADDFAESLRAPLPGDDLVAHKRIRIKR